MKSMKKLASLLLALAMIFTLATTAFADGNTITVNNAQTNETYNAYKMFDLSVDDPANPKAYSYKVNAAWEAFFADTEDEWKTVFAKDAQGYITAKDGVKDETEWSATSALSAFAEAAAQYAKNLTPVDTKVADGTSVVLTTTEPGYYLITSTLGSRAMIDTTPGNVTINEKNPQDTIEKKVKEDSTDVYGAENDAQVGDRVEFKSTVTIEPRSINVKIHDTMDEGLTFTAGSIQIYTDEDCKAALNATNYEILNTPDTGDTFTIKINDSFAATATAAQKLYITYTATLNENAVVKDDNGVASFDQNNKTKVSFGAGSESTESTTKTTTHKFNVFKHATESNENLAGAKFQLKKDNAVVKLFKIDNNNYRIAVTGDETAKVVTEFITVADGDIVIWGVDDDDTYTLEEIEPPIGYNKLKDPVSVTFKTDGTATRIDVENKFGTELPSTGGMGTTLFYVLGGVLVAAAVVLLVTKKRMAN